MRSYHALSNDGPIGRSQIWLDPRVCRGQPSVAMQRQQPAIWVVSADHWPRAYLRAELIERGYDAIGFESAKDVVVRLTLRQARPELLVLDLDEHALDEKLRRYLADQKIPVLALAAATGVAPDQGSPVVETLRRPLTIGAIADAVARRVPIDH
jgi:FixJ family two-component response regulator